MRITFVSPRPNLSGGCRVIAIHADLLQEMGHEVTVVAPAGPPARSLRDRARALLRGRLPRREPKGRRPSHYDGMRARLILVERASGVSEADLPEADVVIATFWTTAPLVAALPPGKGRKFYFVQHHEIHVPYLAPRIAETYRLPLKKIAVAGWLAEVMRDLYGDGDVAVVPNSVDPALFHAPPRDRQPVPTVGLMYSPAPFKGVDQSLAAIEMARRRHPGLQVVAFGKQEPTANLPLPPGSRYFLNPAQQDLRAIYALCDVFLMGSRSEGFGLPVLEAMACRCPVVAMRTGCAPDVIEEGVNGFTVAPGDVEAFGARLGDLLDRDPVAWRAMSEAALAQASGYGWRDAARRFEAALLAGSLPPA